MFFLSVLVEEEIDPSEKMVLIPDIRSGCHSDGVKSSTIVRNAESNNVL